MVMLPDPLSFRVLPWAPHSGWLLCDLYLPGWRANAALHTGAAAAARSDRLAERGLEFFAGIEIECHVLKAGEPQPDGQPGGRGTC